MSEDTIRTAQSIVGFHPEGRPENDFYPTPPEATEALLMREEFPKLIWEPACGDGAMVTVLKVAGYDVFSSDIEPRGIGDQLDFLRCGMLNGSAIITNPPFTLALQFAQHSLALGAHKVALLCKLAFLEGQERSRWLSISPLKAVYVFSKRLTLYRDGIKMKNGGMIAFAWFVWEQNHHDEPVVRWIQEEYDPDDR
jgi:hypothetical protein